MSGPIRARYGAKDNAHVLLSCDDRTLSVPAKLLGLTDRPPGTLGPRDRWWPSVGCGPVDGFWALWWTEPDEKAQRGGMVRSEVALWPLDQIGQVHDLDRVMASLGGRDRIEQLTPEGLHALAEALLSSESAPLVIPDLERWPGILVTLWTRLWPAARRAFSARVAIVPPGGGESAPSPWMYGVPEERRLQWSRYPLINVRQSPAAVGRAARWLVGTSDPVFDEVVSGCAPLGENIAILQNVARAADRLERMRATATPESALDLLRTLILLVPRSDSAKDLKSEAVRILEQGLATESAGFVQRLANLDLDTLPSPQPIENAVQIWIHRRAPELDLVSVSQLLTEMSPGRANQWWKDAIRAGLASGLEKPDPTWASAVLHWLGLKAAAKPLAKLLATTPEIEQSLLDVTSNAVLGPNELRGVRKQSARRGWSRLHAWAAMQEMSPKDALRTQRSFTDDPWPGLSLLVEQLPGEAVVTFTISRPEPRLLKLVARRTLDAPDLLTPMDASHEAWRSLWAAHVAAGGKKWPPATNRDTLGRGLLDALLDANVPGELITVLAEDLAEVALVHPRRSELWQAAGPGARNALLAEVAQAMSRACETGRASPTPERELANAVVASTRSELPSIRVLAMIVGWDVPLDESDVISWFSQRRSGWAPVAASVGRAVQARSWTKLAESLYRESSWRSELRPAVDACRDLLSRWQRLMLDVRRGGRQMSNGVTEESLVERTAELGAQLAPDRLRDLWERAGGELSRLPIHEAPDEQWRRAARLAQSGALKNGLVMLIEMLRKDFPHNPELRELMEVVSDQKTRR